MINAARTILTLQLSFSHSNCPGSRTCWQCSIGTQTPSVNRRSRRLNGLTSRHSDGGPTPCVHKALAEDPEFVVEIVQIALNNGSGTPRTEGAERENDAAGRSPRVRDKIEPSVRSCVHRTGPKTVDAAHRMLRHSFGLSQRGR